jgi:hypothetical protein
MRIDDIELHAGDLDRPYTVIADIRARVQSPTAFSRTRTTDEVDSRIREEAMKVGGNAVINVRYDRGASLTSWKALVASGTAVLATAMYRECPNCREQMRRDAKMCPHCRSET